MEDQEKQEFQARWTRFWQTAVVIFGILSVVATTLAGLTFFGGGEPEEPVARSYSTNCYTEQGGAKIVAASGCEIEMQSGATFDVQAGATVGFSGADIALETGLYPLGIASADQEIVCATTSTFTGSTTIDVTALSTVTQVLAMQVTAPVTTAASLHASDPATTTFTLTSLTGGASAPFNAGTTGIAAHYCAVGDK
jgi:hypothetical protein